MFKNEKWKEFIELKQNNMMVAEYGLKFTQLSAYVANLVATEEEKCQKFEEGLIYDIRSKLTPYDLETFSWLTAAAIRAEKLVNERKTLPSNQGESSNRFRKRKEYPASTSKGGNNKRGFTSSKRGWTGSSSQSGQGQRTNSNQNSRCSTCSRYHFGECRMVTCGCYHCGDMGHRIHDCPKCQYTCRVGSEPTIQGLRTPSVTPDPECH